MTLSIIIVNWNTRALLADCLASIVQTAGDLEYEVIVSDNGSTDDSRECCRVRFPRVIFLENGSNLGFAAANNRGLAIARGEYCLLLNSDTIVEPGALQTAVAAMDAQPQTGGLGCMLKTPDGGVQRSVEVSASLGQSLRHHLHLGTPVHKRRDFYDHEHSSVEYVSGAFLMLRREALSAAGQFDEQFFMYAEEADLLPPHPPRRLSHCLYTPGAHRASGRRQRRQRPCAQCAAPRKPFALFKEAPRATLFPNLPSALDGSQPGRLRPGPPRPRRPAPRAARAP